MTGPRATWWPWFRALDALPLSDGARATGQSWAIHCWDWRSGLAEHDVLARVATPTLEEFRSRCRPAISERTLRRHFAQLQAAGLLERLRGHSRHGPDVYAPRLPVPAGAPEESPAEEVEVLDEGQAEEVVEEANSGHQRPVSEGTQQRTPVSGADQQRTSVSAVGAVNTGHQRPQHRTFGDTPPISPEVVQTPQRAGAGASAGVRARERAREDGGGGSWSPEEEQQADQTLAEVLRAMPADLAPKVTSSYRRECRSRLLALLAAGWPARQLVADVTQPSWRNVASPGGVLAARLEALGEQAVPAAAGRPPSTTPRCGACDPSRMVETDQGLAYCPTCHPLAGASAYVRPALPPPASTEVRRALLEQARQDIAAKRAAPALPQEPAATGARR